jgi:hypothetical protein
MHEVRPGARIARDLLRVDWTSGRTAYSVISGLIGRYVGILKPLNLNRTFVVGFAIARERSVLSRNP